jgi:histone arginine demethylase JMJD6
MTNSIDRREKLSYEEFGKEYLYANKPVIVTDALCDWTALHRWTPEFFKNKFGNVKFTLDDNSKGKAEYEGQGKSAVEYTMDRFIDLVLCSTNADPAPYFRNQLLYELFPSLKDDIKPLPEYFQPNWLPDRYIVKYVGEILNRGAALELFIGGKGASFPVLHYDGSGTHAFVMQVYGRKQFIIYSPGQEQFLYPWPERPNISLINSIDNPDLKTFPLFAKAQPTIFILEPGELLFIPSHWWHTAKMLTACISVSANVVNQSNWHELVDFVSERRRNPLVSFASRMYLAGAGAKRSWRDREWRKRV